MPVPGPRRVRCWICAQMPPELMALLDNYLHRPDEWPEEWRDYYRRAKGDRNTTHAVAKAAKAFLDANGHPEWTMGRIQGHINHKTWTAVERQDATSALVAEPSPSVALRGFYIEAIALGRSAMTELSKRIHKKLEGGGIEALSNDELLTLAKLGGTYAASAATLQMRATNTPPLDDIDAPSPGPVKQLASGPGGFMGGSDAPSVSIGHHRVRTINGERRPVVDDGTADRDAYNLRARQMGDDPL